MQGIATASILSQDGKEPKMQWSCGLDPVPLRTREGFRQPCAAVGFVPLNKPHFDLGKLQLDLEWSVLKSLNYIALLNTAFNEP